MTNPDSTSNSHTFFGDGLKQQARFIQWWSTCRQSQTPPTLHSFLINLGVSTKCADKVMLDVLEDVCTAMSLLRYRDKILLDVSEDGASEDDKSLPRHRDTKGAVGPGVIDYFLHYLPAGSGRCRTKQDHILQNVLLLDPAPQNTPTEQELLSLADETNPADWNSVLGSCMGRNCSAKFLEAMCDKASDSNMTSLCLGDCIVDDAQRHPAYRLALDLNCIQGIKKLLLTLKSLNMSGKWSRKAFVEMLCSLLAVSRLKRLVIGTSAWVEDCEPTAQTPLSLAISQNKQLGCSIHDLKYQSAGDPIESDLVFKFILHLPKLQKLRITVDLEKATSHIVKLIRCSPPMLEDLSLFGNQTATMSILLTMLEALADNSTLHNFAFMERPIDLNLATYQEKLTEVLREDNSTLTQVRLCGYSRGEESVVAYYLKLNHYGRKMTRDQHTSAAQLVEVLIRVKTDADLARAEAERWVENSSDTDAAHCGGTEARVVVNEIADSQLSLVRFYYGLLREMPGTWCLQAAAADGRSGGPCEPSEKKQSRKRKRQSD